MVHGSRRAAAQPHVTPRWVKVLGLAAVVLVALAGLAMVTGIGGTHGPWRHMSVTPPQGNSQQ